jgi:ankyrin repeat protein
MWACWYGHTATAGLLIAKGADVKAKDWVRQGDRAGKAIAERESFDLVSS